MRPCLEHRTAVCYGIQSSVHYVNQSLYHPFTRTSIHTSHVIHSPYHPVRIMVHAIYLPCHPLPVSASHHGFHSQWHQFTIPSSHLIIHSPRHQFRLSMSSIHHVIQSGSWSMPSIYHVIHSPSQPFTVSASHHVIQALSHPINPRSRELRSLTRKCSFPAGYHLGEGRQHPEADHPIPFLPVLPFPPARTLRPYHIPLLITIFPSAEAAMIYLY